VRITLHLSAVREVEVKLRKNGILRRLFAEDKSWIRLHDDDPRLGMLFEFCVDYQPTPVAGNVIVPCCLTVSTEFHLEASEWEQLFLFQVLGMGTRISAGDEKFNFETFLNEPLADKGGWKPVRTATTLAYRDDRIGRRKIVQLTSGWAYEFIIGQEVESEFRSARLSGFQIGPVRGKRGQGVNPAYFHLLSDHFCPPCLREATAWDRQRHRESHHSRYTEADTRYAEKGLVCLPRTVTPATTLDLCRTSDPLGPNNSAGWLVSREVVKVVANRGLSGWWFAPVLIEGTPVYKEYMSRMKRIESWVSMHKFNDFMTTNGSGMKAALLAKYF